MADFEPIFLRLCWPRTEFPKSQWLQWRVTVQKRGVSGSWTDAGASSEYPTASETRAADEIADDVSNTITGYSSRSRNKGGRASHGSQVSQTCQQPAWKTRSCKQTEAMGNFCSWLLLALAQGLQAGIFTQNEHRLLDRKAEEKLRARCCESGGSACTRFPCSSNLGMRGARRKQNGRITPFVL